jgi:glycosyltransferase involved in cell wall biosynthesis
MKLTIGIPTYNRPDTVLKTISKLISPTNSNQLNFLIIDNGSDTNIANYFHDKLPSLTNLSIKRFNTNLGFYESFYRLFDECETEYLMTLSDEDYFDLDYLDEVLKVLNSESPNLLVISAKNKSTFMQRKRTRKIPLYRLKDETSYISGLIYKTKPVKENINFFRNLSKLEEFAFLYPAVLVAFALSLDGKCLSFKEPGIKIGDIVPTTVTSSRGRGYKLPTERVYQYISLLNCIHELRANSPKHALKINLLQAYAKLNFHAVIYDSIGRISVSAQADFVFSSSKTFLFVFLRKISGVFQFSVVSLFSMVSKWINK